MARVVGKLRLAWRGMEECRASLGSIGEALSNACIDDVEIEGDASGLTSMGVTIASIDIEVDKFEATVTITPAAGIVLFAAALMVKLPGTAKLTWVSGWPHIYCPPNDDREVDEDPTPLVPNELVPA